MTWKRDNGPDGLAVWHGHDSIVNLHQRQAWENLGCGYPAFGMILCLAVTFVFMGVTGGRPVDAIGAVIGCLMLVGCAPVAWVIWTLEKDGGPSTRAFFDEAWTLREIKSGSFHGLAFLRRESETRPAESWTSALSEIARVEAAPTKHWLSARNLGAVSHEVTAHEGQAFLFLNDGSRRVVCSINGDLESAATLAQSVRSWFAATKAGAVVPPKSHAGQEGYDI